MTSYISPKSKIFQHLDRLQAIKEGNKPAPVSVEIDPSNFCSLGCSWCHFGYTHTRGPLTGKMEKPQDAIAGGNLLDYDLGASILTQLADYGVKSVTWTGGGEPTLNPRFNDLVRYADSVGLEQGLYSHGGHVDAERALLLKRTLTWAYISLDECTPEAYKESKGVNRFQHATDGIRRLVLAPGAATIGVGFLLHKNNYTQIFNMQKLARDLGADYCQFRPTVHFEQDKPGELTDDTAWVTEAVLRLEQYKGDPFVIADTDRFTQYRDWKGHGYSQCFWSAVQTVITPNGKVWRCTNKREYPDGLLGDLTVESFADLWQRSGGSCAVNDRCRTLCRGHFANQVLNEIYADAPHANFP